MTRRKAYLRAVRRVERIDANRAKYDAKHPNDRDIMGPFGMIRWLQLVAWKQADEAEREYDLAVSNV